MEWPGSGSAVLFDAGKAQGVFHDLLYFSSTQLATRWRSSVSRLPACCPSAGTTSNWMEYRLGIGTLNLLHHSRVSFFDHLYEAPAIHHSGSASRITSPILILKDCFVLNASRIGSRTRKSLGSVAQSTTTYSQYLSRTFAAVGHSLSVS